MERLAFFDSLTDLANREALRRALRDAVDWAQATGGKLLLLAIDLDDFKLVNDRYGHEMGDRLLREVASRLRGVVRASDVLARQGGDEFAILVRQPDDEGHALAARVVAALHEPLTLGGVDVELRASVGATVLGVDSSDGGELLRHADAAMYVAKRAGKDRFHVHARAPRRTGPDPIPTFAAAAHAGELARILAGQLVEAVYQSVVRLDDRSVVAYEALARGPAGSPLRRPDHLFATAAAAGRTVELDWLCRIAAVRGAMAAGLGHDASLLINSEPAAIGAPCPERFRGEWQRAGEALDIVVEITERGLVDCPSDVHGAVSRLRSGGLGLAVDDVGADMGSLALLPFVRPDVIKLDLRLVQDRPSPDQAAIVGAVASEAERTDAAVVAEGVERDEHVAVALTLGATYGQGWLFGRPGALDAGSRAARRLPRSPRLRAARGETPFELVAAVRPLRYATKSLLLPMSHHLEQQAVAIGGGGVLLSAFQHARNFTPATSRRYEAFARTASLVAALGVDLEAEPAFGVRGAPIDDDDALAGEWSVVVIGPHYSGALVGADVGDDGPERDRRFRFAMVYDRELVLAAGRTLLGRLTPP